MATYVLTSPRGKRYRVTTPGSTPPHFPAHRGRLESPLAKGSFQFGGQLLGGLTGEALNPAGGAIPGGIVGGISGELLRQGLSMGTQMLERQPDPESIREHAVNVFSAGESAAIGEALTPLLKTALKGGFSSIRKMTTGFPAQKAEEIRAALRTYHDTQIRQYFKPLYDAIQAKMSGMVKPVAELQQALGTLLEKFGVIDSSGEAINEANLGQIQKKVLSIYRSFKQPASTTGVSAKALADMKQILTNKYGTVNQTLLDQALGQTSTAGSAAVQEVPELFSHMRKLRDMVSDSVIEGRALSDADNAIGKAAARLISHDLQPGVPELGALDVQYADRIQFLQDATEKFRPSSRSTLDIGQGEELLKKYPGIDTGEHRLLTEIERRTGLSIHAPTAVNAGVRTVGREAIPFAVGGGAASIFRQQAPTSAFVGYFLGRHLANILRGAGQVASAGGQQVAGLLNHAVPGLVNQLESSLAGGLIRGSIPAGN